MIKKTLLLLTLSFVLLNLYAKDDTKGYSFIDKKTGLAVLFPADWNIYVSDRNAPDYFKALLKDKKPDSMLKFLAASKDQSAFARCFAEHYEAGIDEYIDLYMQLFDQSKLIIEDTIFSNDKKSAAIIYKTFHNNIPINFIDFITVNNNFAVRITFWSAASSFTGKIDAFKAMAENTLFKSEDKKAQWIKLWDKNFDFSGIKPINNTKGAVNTNRYMFFPVKGKKNTVYIMGSIHVGNDSFYPLSDDIESAFKNTDNIVFEINIDSPENTEKGKNMEKYASLKQGETLDKMMTKEIYDILKFKLESYGLPVDKFLSYKPWMICITLQMLKTMSLGYSADTGTEKYFLKKIGDKKVYELESFDEQINMLESISSNSFIGETLLELDRDSSSLNELIDSWKTGDLKKMEELIFNESSLKSNPDYYKRMFFDRNIKMVEKISGYLTKNADYFVVVGSGHLLGDKGILSLLKAKGYEVVY